MKRISFPLVSNKHKNHKESYIWEHDGSIKHAASKKTRLLYKRISGLLNHTPTLCKINENAYKILSEWVSLKPLGLVLDENTRILCSLAFKVLVVWISTFLRNKKDFCLEWKCNWEIYSKCRCSGFPISYLFYFIFIFII